MTIGWIYEGDWDRWYETVGRGEDGFTLGALKSKCLLCNEEFELPGELERHYSLVHPLERPVLAIHGMEPPHESLQVSPILANRVTSLGCTEARLAVNGGPSDKIDPGQLGTILSRLKVAHVRIILISQRSQDDASTEARYEITFRIPDSARLRKVDEAFVRRLATDALSMSVVRRFCEDLAPLGAEADYVGALAGYVTGILIKEQSPGSGVTLPFVTYADHLRRAIKVLCLYTTPIARIVTRAIQINLNEFDRTGTNTGAPDLDRAFALFHYLAMGQLGELPDEIAGSEQTPVCPTDRTTHRLVNLAAHYPRLTESDLAYLDGASRSPSTAAVDRAKAAAMLVAHSLSVGVTDSKLAATQNLQNDPVFGDWARQLSIFRNQS